MHFIRATPPNPPGLGRRQSMTQSPTTQPPKVTFADPVATALSQPGWNQVDMPDGVVDMEAYGQILALDDDDPTREFSKALVWSWCEQAEHAVEEMEAFNKAGNIIAVASKAQYLKGSSASLGLVRVARTCVSIHRLHFPPTLANFRQTSTYSATPELDWSSSSSSTSSYASSSSSATHTPSLDGGGGSIAGSSRRGSDASMTKMDASPSINTTPMLGQNKFDSFPGFSRRSTSPTLSTHGVPVPVSLGSALPMDFEANTLERAEVLIQRLKAEIREASEWLCRLYEESDRYEGVA